MLVFYKTSLGKKLVVASTGIVLFGFVVAHMLGNLKTFMGFDQLAGLHHLDIYAHFLREMGQELAGYSTLLWVARLVLLVCLVLHVITVIQLQGMNSAGRPVAYGRYKYQTSSYAARSMFWGGILLLVFVVYHILHMTTGTLHFKGFQEGHVYFNLYSAFQVPSVVGFYALAMAALAFHIYHGVWSLFQTFGMESSKTNKRNRMLACTAALLLFVGFVCVPLAALCGYLPQPQELNLMRK